MRIIEITIKGITPLLCNRFTEEAAAKASSGSSSSLLTGNPGAPVEQARPKLYLDGDEQPCIPQPNLFRCIIDAGKYFKAGKTKITTAKSSIIPACVEIEGTDIPIVSEHSWTVDERPIRNPVTGGRRNCYRPRFDDWELSFVVNIDDSMLSANLLREIVDAAGKKIGLGDFRPDCKGPFGKFVVTKWKESSSAEYIAAE